MPISGRKPKPEGTTRHRVKPVHEWTEIENVPFEDAPPLGGRASKAVERWWKAISTMPHCVLWTEADWQFARDTARLVAASHQRDGLRYMTEIRARERILGNTVDARRDLRIRYVEAQQQTEDEEDAGVTSLADYRAALV